jgi:glycosyltransferase involved in cell wall biosynthesis
MQVVKITNRNPLISVIIPHRPDRVGPICLITLGRQSYKNLEVIVATDDKYEGAAAARNAGYLQAKGKFLFFCDDDVVLRVSCINKMYEAIADSKHGFAYCDYLREGKLTGPVTAQYWDYDALKVSNYVDTMSLMRREVFQGFDNDLKRYIDWDHWLRAGKLFSGVYIPEALFTKFYDDKSISLSTDKEDVAALNVVKRKHGL